MGPYVFIFLAGPLPYTNNFVELASINQSDLTLPMHSLMLEKSLSFVQNQIRTFQTSVKGIKVGENKKIESDIKEKLVAINRITKVVKGGRRFGFAALVVVGNQKGSIGIGQGKSKQVPDAIKKATEVAKRNL